MMSRCLLALLFLTSALRQGEAWSTSPLSVSSSVSATTRTQRRPFLVPTSATTTTTTLHAGFGGAGQQPQTSKEIKLKPKQQWDRYLGTLKKETPYKVAVRPVDSESWFVVGSVKSQGSDQTALAVARQRALIAEHAKRLYPIQILPKVAVEWGYAASDDSNDWTKVDKLVLENAPDGLEKIIGFEGKPDPNSGFYCVYNEGRLVSNESSDLKPTQSNLTPKKTTTSKKLGS